MVSIDWSKLTRLDYWFEGVGGASSITPPIEQGSWFFWFFLSIFTGVFVFGVILKLVKSFLNENHPLQQRLDFWGSNVIAVGFTGVFWFLLRQLSVGLLGARFWIPLLLVWLLVIVYFAFRYLVYYFRIEMSYYKKFGSLPIFKDK